MRWLVGPPGMPSTSSLSFGCSVRRHPRPRSTSLPNLASVIQAVASGDLPQRASLDAKRVVVTSNDELGEMA